MGGFTQVSRKIHLHCGCNGGRDPRRARQFGDCLAHLCGGRSNTHHRPPWYAASELSASQSALSVWAVWRRPCRLLLQRSEHPPPRTMGLLHAWGPLTLSGRSSFDYKGGTCSYGACLTTPQRLDRQHFSDERIVSSPAVVLSWTGSWKRRQTRESSRRRDEFLTCHLATARGNASARKTLRWDPDAVLAVALDG
jgi:hypothetical protein